MTIYEPIDRGWTRRTGSLGRTSISTWYAFVSGTMKNWNVKAVRSKVLQSTAFLFQSFGGFDIVATWWTTVIATSVYLRCWWRQRAEYWDEISVGAYNSSSWWDAWRRPRHFGRSSSHRRCWSRGSWYGRREIRETSLLLLHITLSWAAAFERLHLADSFSRWCLPQFQTYLSR